MSHIGAKTLVDLGWSVVLDNLAKRCRTLRGEELAKGLEPDLDRAVAERRITAVLELRKLKEEGMSLSFAGVTDIESSAARASKGGTLSDEELVAIAAMARAITRLHSTLSSYAEAAPTLRSFASSLCDLGDLHVPIEAAYDSDGRLADHASAELGKLRREVSRASEHLRRRMQSMVAEMGDNLQDTYFTQRGERFVLPVRVGARGYVPGIVHGTSQSGQTVFVEPAEAVTLGNQLKLAECAVADEEERIRAAFSRLVGAAAGSLIDAGDDCTLLDVVAASADLADATNSVAAIIEDGVGVDLRNARHPHLVLAGKPCVANDVRVEASRIMIVSGPNAGGKTVALKTVGLAVLMSRAGLHVLAESGSRLQWFDEVFTDIGDAQNLEKDLSTFSGHLLNLRYIAERASPSVLLLVDEIAVGTEPEQGAALACAILEDLAEKGVNAVITTHYQRLKGLAAENPRFTNASVGFDMTTLKATFQLHAGVPGSSGALVVAREMGIGNRIVERAEELLGAERTRLDQLLLELTAERDRLADEEQRLREAMAASEREMARAKAARLEAREAEQRAHRGAFDEAVASLREARLELDRARQSVRKRPGKLAEVGRAIDRAAGRVRDNAPVREAPQGQAPEPRELAVGTGVYIISLAKHGQVQEAPERGRVAVSVGGLRIVVALDDLRLGKVPPPKRGNSKPQHRSTPTAVEDARGQSATLDLRGARVEEALELVDRFIDDAMLMDLEEVFIIHGHGTGALRSAIRAHLRRHAAIVGLRPGERAEGGDGVTVAALSGDG